MRRLSMGINRAIILALVVAGAGVPASAWGSGSIVGWGQHVVGVDLAGPFTKVAAGGSHSLGVKSDGSIVAWGYNSSSQCNVPAPNSGFAAVAAGALHSLGLKSDGSIAAWGYNGWGQCNVPAPNSGFVAVAAGEYHSLAIQSIRSVRALVSPKAIRLQPNQVLTVAILSEEDFDARDIDHTTVVFGPNQATCMRDRAYWEDVDGDGRIDLVLKFRCGDTGIQPGDTTVELRGRLYNGDWITGLAEIRTVTTGP